MDNNHQKYESLFELSKLYENYGRVDKASEQYANSWKSGKALMKVYLIY